MDWYLECLRKYAVFSGRARRTEYWMFVLFNLIIGFLLGAIEGCAGIAPETNQSVLGGIFWLAVLLPSLAVLVRRLHDTGLSGWWALLTLIPLIGYLILLVFLVQDSEPGYNAYGPSPK